MRPAQLGIWPETDLAPAELAEARTDLMVGIATEQGSRTSHTAIVARALGVPAVVGAAGLLDAIAGATTLAVDGDAGEIHVDPGPATMEALDSRAAAVTESRHRLAEIAGTEPAATADGVRGGHGRRGRAVHQRGRPRRRAGVEVGIMVEVPSAVFLAPELADRLDFFSIGTNDLTQYLHAADRLAGPLAGLQDPFSPAVLRAVDQICRGADGKAWVGMCGEAGGDQAWALVAVGLGVDERSMGAGALLPVKAALRRTSMVTCQEAARAAV
ncbi:MAG: putative PEP-binding protein, partial [Acidimicrobiales bacterium]